MYPEDMHARYAVALLATLGLVSGHAVTARNDVNLEAANPVRPSPTPPLGLDELPSPPAPERVRLGRWLFYDTRLSGDGTVSCATCHVPNGRSPTGRDSHGVRVDSPAFARRRRSSTTRTHSWTRFGWDGRAASLEEQSLLPVFNQAEMASTESRMVATLSRIPGYARTSSGRSAMARSRAAGGLGAGRLPANALERQFGVGPLGTGDAHALSPSARRGWELFTGDAHCSRCHSVRTSPTARFTIWDSAGTRRRSATRTKGAG